MTAALRQQFLRMAVMVTTPCQWTQRRRRKKVRDHDVEDSEDYSIVSIEYLVLPVFWASMRFCRILRR